MSARLARAIRLAAEAHDEQSYAGRPYILHPLRVADAVRAETGDESAELVAILHDVIEDHPRLRERVLAIVTADEFEALEAVTRVEGETYADFIKRAAAHPIGRVVKLHDVCDHLRHAETLKDGQVRRYARAFTVLQKAFYP